MPIRATWRLQIQFFCTPLPVHHEFAGNAIRNSFTIRERRQKTCLLSPRAEIDVRSVSISASPHGRAIGLSLQGRAIPTDAGSA